MSGRLAAWILLVLAIAGANYAGREQSGQPAKDTLYQYSTAFGSLVAYVVILAIVLAIVGGRRDLLALRRPRSWRTAFKLIPAFVIGVFVIVAALEPLLHAGREQGLTPPSWEPSHAGAYAANFVVIAGVAPIVEELMFRGAGFALLERFGKWPAIVLVGVAFAVSHGLVQGLPDLIVFGSALAWLRWKTGSVYPGMLVHGTFNAIQLIAAVTVH